MTAQAAGAFEDIVRDINRLETAVGAELANLEASPILNKLAEDVRVSTIQDSKSTFVSVFEEMRQAVAALPATEAECDRFVRAISGLYTALLTRNR
jgi:hypothetical protein